jgi:acyl dehydratase
MELGQSAHVIRKFDQTYVDVFAALSGDKNPIHIDPEAGRNSKWGSTIVHGTIIMGMFSDILGTKFPGHGTLWVEEHIKFLKAVPVGSCVRAVCTLKELLPKNGAVFTTEAFLFDLNSLCDGEKVVTGEAIVKLPR